MSKAFTREGDAAPEDDFDGEEDSNPIPPGSKNYLTPAGWKRMRDEVTWLVKTERPNVTSVVSWAAKLGDRSDQRARAPPWTSRSGGGGRGGAPSPACPR